MKKIAILAAAIALIPIAAMAAEPTLNDLPGILQKLRGCQENRGVFGNSTVCKVDEKDLWVSVSSSESLTLFRNRSYGDTTYARGNTVSALLRDFAAHLNEDRDAGKTMLDAMAPYLPSQ